MPVAGGLTVCSRSPCLLSPSSISPLPSLMASGSLATTLFAQGSSCPGPLVLFHRHHLQFFFKFFFSQVFTRTHMTHHHLIYCSYFLKLTPSNSILDLFFFLRSCPPVTGSPPSFAIFL